MKTCIIGIDPGADGGLAFLHSDGAAQVFRIKLNPLNNPFQHAKQIADMLPDTLTPSAVVLERAQASPQMGVSSAFKYGRTAGMLYGIFGTRFSKIALVEISPSLWKPRMKLTTDKAASIELARKLYALPTKLTHGMAEALLIAHYYQTVTKPRKEAQL